MRLSDSPSRAMTQLLVLLSIVFLAGCPAPTPGERISQLEGKVVDRGGGVIDLDLSNTTFSDDDFPYVHGYCSNDRRYKDIHTLNLANTEVTDQFLASMTLQGGRFVSNSGLQVLVLTGTNTSDRAIEEYQAVDPDCRIVR